MPRLHPAAASRVHTRVFPAVTQGVQVFPAVTERALLQY